LLPAVCVMNAADNGVLILADTMLAPQASLWLRLRR
jgi:hypothetical protein